MFGNSSCLFVCLKSSYNSTVSGGPNSSLIKVYILEYIFTSNRQSTVRIQSSIVSAFVRVSHRRSLVVLASRRRSRVASASERRLTHGPPSCSLVGDIDTWSRESGQGTHGGRGRRGGRPSPAGNRRVFSLTGRQAKFKSIEIYILLPLLGTLADPYWNGYATVLGQLKHTIA